MKYIGNLTQLNNILAKNKLHLARASIKFKCVLVIKIYNAVTFRKLCLFEFGRRLL